jgi:hypothetical protein
MCHFLTISVPRNQVPDVPEEFRRKLHFAEHTNPSITKYTPPDWISFTATSGGCSCGFYSASDEKARLTKKYQKKGWSDTKVRRALDSHKSKPVRSAGLRSDVVGLVTELIYVFGEIRLSLHWYSGEIETEDFLLNDAGCLTLESFRQDTTSFRDETIIRIKGEPVVRAQRR